MALYIGDKLIAGSVDGQQLNNPFSLLDYKYSEYELDNASWLISNGQYNSGATYPAVYNLLLAIYNGTTTKAGVSVKLSTETYTDTDFVLNTSDTTFRLPIKVKLPNSKGVAGNGTDMNFYNPGYESKSATLQLASSGGGTVWGNWAAALNRGVPARLQQDTTKSGIEVKDDSLIYLYFYVGEVVQDANIIAAGQALTDIADLKNASNFSQTGLSTLSGLGMPSDNYDELTAGASGATYTAPANGYFCAASSNSWVILAYDKDYSFANECPMISGVSGGRALIPVKKGDIVNLAYGSIARFRFYYAEGEN